MKQQDDAQSIKPQGIKLKSMPGEPVDPSITEDLKALGSMPDTARGKIWEVLGPLLGEAPSNSDRRQLIEAFSRQHRVNEGDVRRAIGAARFLVRGAARQQLPVDQFVEDLELLNIGVPSAKALVSGYEMALKLLQFEFLHQSLVEHGRLLTGVDWRMDSVHYSNHGRSFGAAVGNLTLKYSEGGEEKRITLQALPDKLLLLRDAINQLLTPQEGVHADDILRGQPVPAARSAAAVPQAPVARGPGIHRRTP